MIHTVCRVQCDMRHVGCQIDCKNPEYLADEENRKGKYPFESWAVVSGYRYEQCNRNRGKALREQQKSRRDG